MSENICKGFRKDGVKCSRSAREGSEFCCDAHELEQPTLAAVEASVQATKDAYKIVMANIGDTENPSYGVMSGHQAVELLQMYNDDGYDLFSVNNYGYSEGLGELSKHYRVMYTFKLRDA